eukprot:scaffold92108_cov30-Tisochrysis_lutea.AAC.1
MVIEALHRGRDDAQHGRRLGNKGRDAEIVAKPAARSAHSHEVRVVRCRERRQHQRNAPEGHRRRGALVPHAFTPEKRL